MTDSTYFPVSSQPEFENLPLPERIAHLYNFALAYHDVDGQRYYAVQDWIAGVAKVANTRAFWDAMKRRAKKLNVELSTLCRQLPYLATNGKRYKMDHADAETLYKITQHMDTNTGLRNDILAYLAKSGVIVDQLYRDPENAAEVISNLRDGKTYQELMSEGFTHEEAIQWLEQRVQGIHTRKWLTSVWRKRQAKGKDFAILTNQISEIVHGKTATIRKKEMGLPKRDTMRNYDAAADQYLTALTEMTAGATHEYRESIGFNELSEDIEDVRPLVDAARSHAYTLFSKKLRRLRSGNTPELSD
jgi:hypothetical protein